MTNQKQTKALKYMFATAMILSQMQAMTPVQAVSTDIQKQPVVTTQTLLRSDVQGNFQNAIQKIKIPKWHNNDKKELDIPAEVIARMNQHTVSGELNGNIMTLDVQLKNVYIDSNYKNGIDSAGASFFRFLEFYTNVLQVEQIMNDNTGKEFKDNQGETIDQKWVSDCLTLLKQIMDFDGTADLTYDDTKEAMNVIARYGSASFTMQIDAHGWWGYDLGPRDNITAMIMGQGDEYLSKVWTDNESANIEKSYATSYTQFFKIKMPYKSTTSTCYMLNSTDLENPMIYVSSDGKDAFMIDVDMYGTENINRAIKNTIGEECENLTIFFTHNHGDHVNNLETIVQDADLKNKIKEIIIPANEQFSLDLGQLVGENKIRKVKDLEEFNVAGTNFKFVEIPDAHTPGGGQIIDLDQGVNYIGDTLGAQVHLGGTNINLSTLDAWIAGAEKTEKITKEEEVQYFIGGHTPYYVDTDFATWVKVACQYAKQQVEKDHTWATKTQTVVVEDGQVISSDRQAEIAQSGLTDEQETRIASINFTNNGTFGNYDQALKNVTFLKHESDGSIHEVQVSDLLKANLNQKDLVAFVNKNQKTITLPDVQLKDVYLDSQYLNGKSPAGVSFYNMVNYYTDILQVQQLLSQNADYKVIDNAGHEVDKNYIDELSGLIEQIMHLDPKTHLVYDMDSVYDAQAFQNDLSRGGTDVIATSQAGNVTLRFHIDSHGWWGYDLGADDSITSLVMGYDQEAINNDRKEHESPITKAYGQFFVIEVPNQGSGKLYMLNGTDLENPMIYVSENGKEAFMIDVDMYGQNVINKVIKSVIGDKCESLKIFFTHNHGDHVNNLATIAQDEELKKMTSVVWPEDEPHTTMKIDGKEVDLVEIFGKDKVETVKDGKTYTFAGYDFKVNQIFDEHTPAGAQLADLKNKIVYCGDTLGAQVHLGGTNIPLSNIDSWIKAMDKSIEFNEANGMKYYIGGHTPYLNNIDFAKWMKVACVYAKEQLAANPQWQTTFPPVIVENGQVITQERANEILANGLTDRQELVIASANFRNDITNQGEQEGESTDSENKVPTENKNNNTTEKQDNNTVHTSENVKTGDQTSVLEYMVLAFASLLTMIVVAAKKKLRRIKNK